MSAARTDARSGGAINSMFDHLPADVEAVFRDTAADTARFWRRIGGKPEVRGLEVMDFGCGYGALALELARDGATVTGVDISADRLAWSSEHVAPLAGEGGLAFRCTDVAAFEGRDRFDLIVSKDTMEHVPDPEAAITHLLRLTKPGGRLMIGTSPLYYSPFGDHGLLGSRLPWAHVLAGKRRVLGAINATNGSSHETLEAAGLNAKRPADFARAFRAAGAEVVSLTINPAESRAKGAAMALLRGLARVPGLAPYATVGLYAVLRKPA